MSATTIPTAPPSIGTLVTMHLGSDCYPCIVSAVHPGGHKIEVSGTRYQTSPGANVYMECCSVSNGKLEILGTLENSGVVYSMRKDGSWARQGLPLRGGADITLGDACYYKDPSR